jgi:hypothetical protein
MKTKISILTFAMLFILSLSTSLFSANVIRYPANPRCSLGNEASASFREEFLLTDAPPTTGTPSLVAGNIDYGAAYSGPNNYSNARHVVHHPEGHPWVSWEWGVSKNNDVTVSTWHDWKAWEDPITISDQTNDAGRIGLAVDSQGISIRYGTRLMTEHYTIPDTQRR